MDAHVQISRQFGIFLRRSERLWSNFRVRPDGPALDRGAYLLLGQIAEAHPKRLSVLAEDVSLDLSTVSRQVTALEAIGLVSRMPDPTDRRACLIGATPTGHEVLADNRERWQAAQHELLSDWTPAERGEFARLFSRFNDALARREARPIQENRI